MTIQDEPTGSRILQRLGLTDVPASPPPAPGGRAAVMLGVAQPLSFQELGYDLLEDADYDRVTQRLQQREGFFGSIGQGLRATLPGGQNAPLGLGAAKVGIDMGRFLMLDQRLRRRSASAEEQREHLDMLTEMVRQPGVREMAGDIVGAMPGFAVDVLLAAGVAGRVSKGLAKGSRDAAVRMIRDRAASEAEKAIAKRAARVIGGGAAAAGAAAGIGATAAVSEFGPQAFGLGGGRWTAYALQRAMPQLQDMQPEDWEALEGLANGALVSALSEDLPLWQGALDNVIEVASEFAGAGIARGLRATVVGGYVLGAQKLVLDKIAANVGNRGPDLLADLAKRARYEGPIVELLEERLGDTARVATGLQGVEELFPELDEFVAEVLALTFPAAGAAGVRRLAAAARPLQPVRDEDFGGVEAQVPDNVAAAATQALERVGVQGARLRAPMEPDEVEAARWAASRGRSLVLFDAESDAGVGGFALQGGALVVRSGSSMSPLALAGHELTETVGLLVPEAVRAAQAQEVEQRFPGLLGRALAEWQARVDAGGRATGGGAPSPRIQRDEALATASEWVAPLMAYAARNAEAAAAVQELAQSPTGGGFWRGVLEALGRFFRRVIDPNEAGGGARELATAAGTASGLSPAEAAQLSQLLSRWIDSTQVQAQAEQAALQPTAPAQAAVSAATPAPAAAAALPQAEVATEAQPARARADRDAERQQRETARRLAAIPLPGDLVEFMREGPVRVQGDQALPVTAALQARVLETLDGGRRLRVRIDEGVQRAGQESRSASENRGRRAETERVIDRAAVRLVAREEPPAGSKRLRLRERALRELQGGPVEEGGPAPEDAEAERQAAPQAAARPRVSDVVRVTARGKQGLADVLAELRGDRLRVRLRPDATGGALARSGSSKNRTVEVALSEVELYERRSAEGARQDQVAAEAAVEEAAAEFEAGEADDVVPGPPTRKRQPRDWPARAGETPAPVPAGRAADDAPVVFNGATGSRQQALQDKKILRAFNLDALVEADDGGLVAENATDQPVLTLAELRRAHALVPILQGLGARGQQTRYQGNKADFLRSEPESLAMALATRQDATTVFGLYSGGGTYELSIVGAGALPKVRRVVLNEVYGPRRARLELALAEGDAFMSEWDTNPTLTRLRAELVRITADKSQTPAADAVRFAIGARAADSRSMYASFASWRSQVEALPLRARAALQAYFDFADVKREAGVSVQEAIDEARADMRSIKRHGDAARARGVQIDVVGLNAYGEDAIEMVRAEPGAVVFLDPPYHRTDRGTYMDDSGVVHDLGSDEQAAAFTYGAVAMAGDNLLIYHNNATPEVRDMLHAQLGDRTHMRLWRRKKKTGKTKAGKERESSYEWAAFVYGRPGDGVGQVGGAGNLGDDGAAGVAAAGGSDLVGSADGGAGGSADAGAAAPGRGEHPRGAFGARFEPVGSLNAELQRMLERGVAGLSPLSADAGRRPVQDFDPFTGLNQPRAGMRAVDQSLAERLAMRTTQQRKQRPLTLVDYVLSMGGLDLRGIMYTNAAVEWAEALRDALKVQQRGLVGILKEATSKAAERGGSPDDIQEGLFASGFRDRSEFDERMSLDTILDAMMTEIGGGLPVFPEDSQQLLEQEFARQEYLRQEEWAQTAPDAGTVAVADDARDMWDLIQDMDVAASVVSTETPVLDVDDEVPFAPAARRRKSGGRIRRTLRELVQAARSQESWRDWYDRHDAVLRELFLEDAELLQRLLAVTSQAASVRTNVVLALKAYGQYLRGEPFVGFLEAVKRNLERVRADEASRGPKIGAYDAATAGDAAAVVVDRHIARLLFNVQVPNGAQIAAAQRRLTAVAEQLGWEPRQVQAALWAFNQVRLGANPETIQSYDRHLDRRRGAIAAIRAAYGRAEAGGVRVGAGADPGADGAEFGLGADEGLRFAPLPRKARDVARSTSEDDVQWVERTETFRLGDRSFEVQVERVMLEADAPVGTLSFARQGKLNKFALTGDTPEAATVLATVVDFVFDEVLQAYDETAFRVYTMSFTASESEPSRVSLYRSMVRRLQRFYGVTAEVRAYGNFARDGVVVFELRFTPASVERIRVGWDRSSPLSPPRVTETEDTRFAPAPRSVVVRSAFNLNHYALGAQFRTERFVVGGKSYEASVTRDLWTSTEGRGDVGFARIPDSGGVGVLERTGDQPAAATVMATVVDFLLDEVLEVAALQGFRSYEVEFTADTREPSRVRLYDAMVARVQRLTGMAVAVENVEDYEFVKYSLTFLPEHIPALREYKKRLAGAASTEQTRFAPGIPQTARAVRDGEGFELGDEVGWEVAGPERPVRRFAAGTPGGDVLEAAWSLGLPEARRAIARLEGPYADEMRVVLDQLDVIDNVGPLVADEAGDRFAPAIDVDGQQRPTTNSDGRPIAADKEGLRAFWRWFGDSKVVDDEGRPLVVYHGTGADFTRFERVGETDYGFFGPGFYFLTGPSGASEYAEYGGTGGPRNGANVKAAYLRAINPRRVMQHPELGGEAAARAYRAETQQLGHDAVWWSDEIVVFDPTQIKSATGNLGTFDPTNPDIRFAPSSVGRKASSLLRSLKEYLVSDVLDIEELQAEVADRMQVGPDADFVGGIDLARSQAPAQMDGLLRRLLEQMRALKGHAQLSDLQRLLYVKTAPARNAWLQVALADRYLRKRMEELTKQLRIAGRKMGLEQLGRMKGEVVALGRVLQAVPAERLKYVRARGVKIPVAPSGIDDLSATLELARLRAKIGTARADAFLEFVRAENRATLDEAVASGILGADRAREWHDREPYYVSLKDLDDELDADAGYARPSRSMSVRGPLFRRAEGRETQADRVLESWLEDKLRRYEQMAKNRGMQSGAALARLDPNVDMRVLERAPRGMEVERSVPFFEEGEQRWLLLPTASAAKTLKGLHGRSVDPVLGMIGHATRFFSRMVTSRNPFFWLPNFLRDSGSALWTLTAERSFREGAQVMARAWSVLPGLLRHAAGKPSDITALVEQATLDGVKTTWVGLTTLQERLQAMHDALAPQAGALSFVRRALRAMDAVSDAFEMATRLAMYQHELERGRTRREAALAAKNITVNFDKKGTLTPSLAALYSFFNPAVQGARRVVQAATSSRRSVAVTAATATLGLVWEVLGYALSDDDEATGQAVYGMLADWTKDRNLHLPFAVGGVYVTYPLPYVISSIFGFGRRMAHLVAPGLDPKVTRTRAIHDAFWQVINESQPLGDVRDPFVALAPTIAKPFVELEQNVKFGGRPIQRDAVSFGTPLPDSARAFSTLGDRASGWLAQHVADVLNAGGPSEVETGIDVSPASIQHLITWIGSGFGLRELDRVSQFWLSSREVPGLANTPLLRNFTNEQSSHAVSENYYELRARADRVWRRAKDLRGGPRAEALAEDPKLYALASSFRATDRRLRALQARMEDAGRQERLELQEQRLALQAGLVRQYYGGK